MYVDNSHDRKTLEKIALEYKPKELRHNDIPTNLFSSSMTQITNRMPTLRTTTTTMMEYSYGLTQKFRSSLVGFLTN